MSTIYVISETGTPGAYSLTWKSWDVPDVGNYAAGSHALTGTERVYSSSNGTSFDVSNNVIYAIFNPIQTSLKAISLLDNTQVWKFTVPTGYMIWDIAVSDTKVYIQSHAYEATLCRIYILDIATGLADTYTEIAVKDGHITPTVAFGIAIDKFVTPMKLYSIVGHTATPANNLDIYLYQYSVADDGSIIEDSNTLIERTTIVNLQRIDISSAGMCILKIPNGTVATLRYYKRPYDLDNYTIMSMPTGKTLSREIKSIDDTYCYFATNDDLTSCKYGLLSSGSYIGIDNNVVLNASLWRTAIISHPDGGVTVTTPSNGAPLRRSRDGFINRRYLR